MRESGPLNKLNIYTLLGTVFGIGFIPFMPGTFGTAAAAAVYLLLREDTIDKAHVSFMVIPLVVLAYFIGVFITGKAEKKLGHDAGSIVFDEFVGYFISVMFLPKSLMLAVYAFAIFRVFDIAKPYPIGLLQKLKGGWGVMTDDILAGVFTNLFLQALIRIYPRFFIY